MEMTVFWPAVRHGANAIEALSEPVPTRLETIMIGLDPGPRDEEVQSTLASCLFPDPDLKPTVTSDGDFMGNFSQDGALTEVDFD